jgi:CelD/BcsL family acetyltransferase involved in cellulose biosynthesis
LGERSIGRGLQICQTSHWLEFLRESQQAEPVVLEILRRDEVVGLFVGAIVRKAGMRILGSPLRGWTTSYMGFACKEKIEIEELLQPLRSYAFTKLHWVHSEVLDRRISKPPQGWQSRMLDGFQIDLSLSEPDLFQAMSPACRRCIRKAEKHGLRVEEVWQPEGFATEFYGQLQQVFARQGLTPSYGQRRVEQLISTLHPTGKLLLLRARNADGETVATSIFPGHGGTMYFWGGASLRSGLHNRPNEAMMWYAMRYWKGRGATLFDMGGGGAYKAKYGGAPIAVPWLRCSLNPLIALLRERVESALRLKQHLARRI